MQKGLKKHQEYKRKTESMECMYLEYVERIKKNLKELYLEKLGLSDIEKRIQKRIDRERGKYFINKIDELIGLKNKKMLDIGSGWGEYVVEASKKGALAYGIEPDDELLEISRILVDRKEMFLKGWAESIHFRDNFFDIVICVHVLEHVNDVRSSIQEMMRVVKLKGYLYIVAPNYLFPYEGHYKIAWIPLIPKFLGKIYLRLLGRDTNFITHINYITSWWIDRELKKYDVIVRNLSEEELNKKLDNKSVVKILILKAIILLRLYPNIELLIRKVDHNAKKKHQK